MQSRSLAWELTGVGAVALFALLAVLDFWSSTLRFNREYPDLYGIGQHERRLAEVSGELPADAVVGYVSDVSFETLDGQTAFFAVQYALAPRAVVMHNSEYVENLVLGYYSRQTDARVEAAKIGAEVGRNFGNGVVLFERETGQ